MDVGQGGSSSRRLGFRRRDLDLNQRFCANVPPAINLPREGVRMTRIMQAAAFVASVSLGSLAGQAAITHTTHNLNLRSGPGTAYAPTAIIPATSAIDVLSCGGQWCRVHWVGHVGYVNGHYLATHATVIVAPLMHYHAVHVATPVVVHHVQPVVVVHHVHKCSYLFC